MNVKKLGQVFTPNFIVNKMINLISIDNPNLIVEPSSGSGNFYYQLIQKYHHVIGIEIDPTIAHENAIIQSYFDTNYKCDVIIGNPPYVDFKNIENKPKSNLLKHKPNLFLYFLEKALNDLNENGELIWIIPINIFTSTSSKELNKIIYENFSITYFEQIKENVWANACVPTAIVKIVKKQNHWQKIDYFFSNGKILFGKKPNLANNIIAKVGGASGFNSKLKTGDTAFVVSTTERTKELKYIEYKPETWIRPVPRPPKDFTYQIFVNCKTRKKDPFYLLNNQKRGQFINYDASVLCLFVNTNKDETKKIVDQLNEISWDALGVKTDGRYHFSQSILVALL
ncbi:Type I restriction-modification system methyltransferase subunit [Metamycoplasma cloacale]|uniref:site-specific DNA-methyltransferase (adenine-specific) n=1 Tax=Metamycoplasma cloacale TaxID=92401 RepID=A0A2Z4LND3_9BACT|nr:N-6 DNA methylase [Metamycoplasma cloacale]AWX42868.1 SAM-dependent methyltransferase [Metamycoplasma cloacale]VEU79310.1 Type I restriction-modification system methyltransferase subunit [Metamycoplasma cloacale]